jgi:cation:H+ antiporter
MIEIILLFIGIFVLVKGADLLVDGSSVLAKKLGIPTLMIGLTIVAFGTSMPELVVNVIAAVKGNTNVAFGNIIGSNVANILLVLGVTAILCPLKVRHSTVWKEIPFSFLATMVLFVMSNYFLIDHIRISSLTRVGGIILLCFFTIFIYYTYEMAKRNKMQLEDKKIEIVTHKGYMIFAMIAGGILGLYFGGQWTINGAIFVAEKAGLSEFMISATIIAIGTSLPELVTGVTAAMKKDADLAVGNSIGSNIFNIFWILGISSIIAPITIPEFINADIMFLAGITIMLFAFIFIRRKRHLEKWQGYVFLALYAAYLIFIAIRN